MGVYPPKLTGRSSAAQTPDAPGMCVLSHFAWGRGGPFMDGLYNIVHRSLILLRYTLLGSLPLIQAFILYRKKKENARFMFGLHF
jgi:hypothetical protein